MLYGVAGTVLAVMALLVAFQDRFVYEPVLPGVPKSYHITPARLRLLYEDVWLRSSDGVHLHAWFIKSMGASDGYPSQHGITKDAQAAIDHLIQRTDIDTSRIVVFGRSLGGAVGAVLAKNNPDKIKQPILFLSGLQDELVPPSHMEMLYARAAACNRQCLFVKFPTGMHMDTWLAGGDKYWRTIQQFMEQTVPDKKDDELQGKSTTRATLGVFQKSKSGFQAVARPIEMFLSEQHSDSDVLARGMDGGGQYNPRTVEEVFKDYKGRRAGMIKALTTDVDDFYQQCDPDLRSLLTLSVFSLLSANLPRPSSSPLRSSLRAEFRIPRKIADAFHYGFFPLSLLKTYVVEDLKKKTGPRGEREEFSILLFGKKIISNVTVETCDNSAEKENLCLYGFPNEQWEVNLPAEEVPPELPEPALGINFARDGMQDKDWLALVAVHSDAWLLSVAFYFGARFGFDKSERKRLFCLINELPTLFEVVTGAAKKQVKDKSSVTNNSSSKSKSNSKVMSPESNFIHSSSDRDKPINPSTSSPLSLISSKCIPPAPSRPMDPPKLTIPSKVDNSPSECGLTFEGASSLDMPDCILNPSIRRPSILSIAKGATSPNERYSASCSLPIELGSNSEDLDPGIFPLTASGKPDIFCPTVNSSCDLPFLKYAEV
nr:PHD finger protein ALFIN-LIKE 4-like isoform X1 [Ipomoea batatas]